MSGTKKGEEGNVTVRIALDAAGGDRMPEVAVEAALQALAEGPEDLAITLVGPAAATQGALAERGHERLEVLDAGAAVPEGGHPARYMREFPDNAQQVLVRAVAQGRADGAVSLGHTGAILIAAMWELGLLDGIERPVAGVVFPFAPRMLFLDAGLNPDTTPQQLVQFARMGRAYARAVFGIEEPRIAILSNGREEGKGNRLTRDARTLLADQVPRYVGAIEGHELVHGPCEVVVTDGFTGNVVLKTIEGMGEYAAGLMREAYGAFANDSMPDRLHGWLRGLADATQSGAPVALLGVRGLVVPGHGRTPAEGLAQTLLQTREAFLNRLTDRIVAELSSTPGDVAASALLPDGAAG